MEEKAKEDFVGSVISRQKDYKNYERVMFCIKAMGKGSDPLFTQYLHVENTRSGSRIVCTDGKRLHVANLSVRISAGNYQPVVKDYSVCFGHPCNIIFPAWKNIVPEDAEYKGVMELGGIGVGSKSERDAKFTNIYCSFLSETGFDVSIGFIKDLPNDSWKIYTKMGRNRLVMLKNCNDSENKLAVFAPLSA